MTSRERVLAVFNRQIPDRVPVWCGASPEFMEKARKHLGVSDDEAVYQRFATISAASTPAMPVRRSLTPSSTLPTVPAAMSSAWSASARATACPPTPL